MPGFDEASPCGLIQISVTVVFNALVARLMQDFRLNCGSGFGRIILTTLFLLVGQIECV